MDLLNENKYQKPQEPKGKKVILVLLILSIILAIAVVCAMVYIETNRVPEKKLQIDGQEIEITEELLLQDSTGNQYIGLKELSDLLGYEYNNNEYQKYGVDTTKCYIKNDKLIYGFELGSTKIYKYEEGTNLDYQYYTLGNKVLTYNNKLYIAISDLPKALNIYCTTSDNNTIIINTVDNLSKAFEEKLKENGYTLTTEQNNKKAIAYGWLIVSRNNIWSILNFNLEEVIGAKYSSIYFDECNLNYIVSNSNGQYGIISTSGNIEQTLKYDSLEILNYKNMLYKVKNNNKYGIMKADGTMLTDIIYDEIGYPAEPEDKILYTLIIPDLDGETGETIVVKQDKKYGLIFLKTGETYLPCDHVEKLYSVSELGQVKYKIEAEKKMVDLLEYLNYRKTLQAELN